MARGIVNQKHTERTQNKIWRQCSSRSDPHCVPMGGNMWQGNMNFNLSLPRTSGLIQFCKSPQPDRLLQCKHHLSKDCFEFCNYYKNCFTFWSCVECNYKWQHNIFGYFTLSVESTECTKQWTFQRPGTLVQPSINQYNGWRIIFKSKSNKNLRWINHKKKKTTTLKQEKRVSSN